MERSRATGSGPGLRKACHGFTLLEVMIAVAFVGIAMLALLSLHQSSLQSVIRAQELTRAAMLAQRLMSTAEVEHFPFPGQTRGDFSRDYPGGYKNFRWERDVEEIARFPDVRRVRITVIYGPRFERRFNLVEFMHNPSPPPIPGLSQRASSDVPGDQGDTAP